MKKLIIGASGAIGSSLARKIVSTGSEVHLVGRNKEKILALSNELNASYSVADVLNENFSDQILKDLAEDEIDGLAYCVGSIELKPLKLTKRSNFMQSFNLNLISATEIIRATYEKLKSNKGSIVLFSTVAAKRIYQS